jgi:hypothetical protein
MVKMKSRKWESAGNNCSRAVTGPDIASCRQGIMKKDLK